MAEWRNVRARVAMSAQGVQSYYPGPQIGPAAPNREVGSASHHHYSTSKKKYYYNPNDPYRWDEDTGLMWIHPPVVSPALAESNKKYPVWQAPPEGKTQFCRECYEDGLEVFWLDAEGMKGHIARKHNASRQTEADADGRTPCIFKCGRGYISCASGQFEKHRKSCSVYQKLLKEGRVEEFLKQYGGWHWQMGRQKR